MMSKNKIMLLSYSEIFTVSWCPDLGKEQDNLGGILFLHPNTGKTSVNSRIWQNIEQANEHSNKINRQDDHNMKSY